MVESTILQERLKETFNGESQETTAKKLDLVQSSISKILKGDQMPSADTLCTISKKYGVSVDWLLGLKKEKDVSPIDFNGLDYRQAFLMLNKLYETNTISLQTVKEETVERESSDSEDEDENETSTVGVNYDVLIINDPVISFMLRRRMKLIGVDPEYFNDWCEKHLDQYKDVPVIDADEDMRKYFAKQQTGKFSDGDWSTAINEYIDMKEQGKDE